MTITDPITAAPAFALVAHDLYRDIHKGLRSQLFAVTESAGSVDPSDRLAGADVAAQTRSLVNLLESHSEHEDAAILPVLETHLPALAQEIVADHAEFERSTRLLVELAEEAAGAPDADRRRLGHQLYLDLSSFTGSYLAHQDTEERLLMPALEQAVGVEGVIELHQAILGSIPPDEMARSLAVMLPAMNLDDRTEMLGGMQAEAPAEVFQGVWGLAGSVLAPADLAALAARLGL